jgi:uncharacterized protein (TIGR03435 family)
MPLAAGRVAQAIQGLGPGYFDKPVVDLTGLTGVYSFSVEWVTKALLQNGGDGPSMFDAVEKRAEVCIDESRDGFHRGGPLGSSNIR